MHVYVGVIVMYVVLNVASVVPCWFPTKPSWLLSRKLPRCTKGENKPPLSPLTRPASLQICTNLPSACWLRGQGSEVRKQSRSNFTASPHSPTIHLSRCWRWLIIWKLWFDHILRKDLNYLSLLPLSMKHFLDLRLLTAAQTVVHYTDELMPQYWRQESTPPPCI